MPFNFYQDSGLTTIVDVGTEIAVTQKDDGSSPPVDRVVYLGSNDVAKKLVAASNPGVDPMVVYFGHDTTLTDLLRLATTSGGLDTATPGAGLNIGTQVLSGVANALPIHIRFDFDPPMAIGEYSDLTLTINFVNEVDA